LSEPPRPLRILARPAFKNAARQPYNALLSQALREQGARVEEYGAGALLRRRWDVVHVHWPESLLELRSRAGARWSALEQLALIDQARWRGARLVWTAHELKPHDLVLPELERGFWSAILRRVDAWISLSQRGLELTRERYPELAALPCAAVPQGHYRSVHAPVARDEARRRLGLHPQARVVVHFGQLRPYKNATHLIRVVRSLPDPQLVLWVAGRLSRRADLETELREAAGNDPRVRLELRHLDDDELRLRIGAADLLAFPFRDILHSSSALLALSLDRPVLLPRLGALPELALQVGPEWVRLYDGVLDAEALHAALEWSRRERRSERAPLERFDWRRVAAATLDLYGRAIASGGRNRAVAKGA
jgi:glycosyltransferase involved in cell wall biosynthesis